MREINGFLNDAVGSETHRRFKTCATDESELSEYGYLKE